MEEKEFIIKRSFRDNASRKLIFNENFLKFEDKNSVNDLYSIFEKENIVDYRFGIRWIRFELTYGREYQIFIRNKENKVLKITFKSYFGRKKNILYNLYREILDELWTYYFSEKVDGYLSKFSNSEEFLVEDILFTKNGITLPISGVLKQKRIVIPWENVRTKNYSSNFSIYSNENPSEINRGYYYKDDWNTNVLYSVIRTILRDKKIEKYS